MPAKKRKKTIAKKRTPSEDFHEAWYGLLSALGQILYITLVVFIFWLAENYLSFIDSIFMAQLLMLTLFVFSAIVSGFIVLGYPTVLALRGEVKKGLKIVGWTAGFMLAALIIGVALAVYMR